MKKFHPCLELLNHIVSVDSPNQTGLFLCTEADSEIVARPINMKTESGVKMRVDQVFNPNSAEILLGGEVGQNLVVNSTLRTTGETAVAKRVFKNLKKKFRAFGAILNFFQNFSQFFSNSYLFPKISGIFIPMS